MDVYSRLLALCVAFVLIASPLAPVRADETSSAVGGIAFNPQAILDDRDIFDVNGMSFDRLQSFLAVRGTLGRFRVNDIDGVEKSAADIIWRVANSYKINPKYLLALMQKEQSLVEDTSPSQKQFDWATGYGVCDDCSMNDPSIQDFKGFANQLEWAAKQHREKYLLQILGRGTTVAGYAPGKTSLIDGIPITPANQATAMLYSYTPHFHGNENLWNIWQRWFALAFPDGTVVRGRSSKIAYLIRFGTKRPFKSNAVLASLVDPAKILTVEDSAIASYKQGKPIALPNYALTETPDGKRYLISGETKRLIASKAVFRKFGFNEDELVEIAADDLADYADGPDITATTVQPIGILAKDDKGGLWYIENGTRSPVPHKAFVSLYFNGNPAKLMSQKKLATYALGKPYRLHDGELVRAAGSPSVYVLENGVRRPIASAATFEEMGWKWKNVVTLPQSVLADYFIGDFVEPQPTRLLADRDVSTAALANAN
jgi:hypothetical protein